ncbi:STE/STE7 protein kinase [Mycena sanguinolenta]|uniref:mitogen-activated protein kinase kinase n=1 Tax=Mycena sanguinolenta TaxID=230812 RepID=A0A8H6ZEP2_9AGAR|nr:STE/STE7 protein kinase [Mycena sanguinolenta]
MQAAPAAPPRATPMGPRGPASLSTNTAPLNIRKPKLLIPSTASSRSPSPSRPVLSIPGAPPRSTTPKLPKININTGGSARSEGGYYGGPPSEPVPIQTPDTGVEEVTIRPDPNSGPSREPLASIRDFITTIQDRPPSSSQSAPPSDGEDPDDAVLLPTNSPNLAWGDDVLEEISRLGEGAGGAVHKLLRELSIISSTEHINIVLFYGAYMSPSSSEVKILMEFGEGGSLEAVGKRIKERNAVVGERIAGRLAEGILQGLAYLHTKKTIHRDIKPSNILLTREGIVKLCDFGVSGELIESIAGTFTGTSFYMAPERIVGQKYTIRSDVWSTGISLLELVQNRFPFPNDLPPIELMMYITAGEPPRLEDEPGLKWSDEMKDFIKQTLTVDALTRPTPKDMLAHPWVVDAMKQEVHMARWIRQVWGWPKTTRRSRDKWVADPFYLLPRSPFSPSSQLQFAPFRFSALLGRAHGIPACLI